MKKYKFVLMLAIIAITFMVPLQSNAGKWLGFKDHKSGDHHNNGHHNHHQGGTGSGGNTPSGGGGSNGGSGGGGNSAPIDGGLSILLAAGLGLGAKSIYDFNKKKKLLKKAQA